MKFVSGFLYFYKMNILQLPSEIIFIIFNDMTDNHIALQSVNKELKELTNDKIKEKHAKYLRKQEFYKKCESFPGKSFYWNAFHSVLSLEECEFLCEKYSNEFGSETFLSTVNYTIGNTFQITAEAWTEYLLVHKN